MKTRLRKDARLLALFAVLAALPLAIWACGDAGDSPGGPTGPASKYNPNKDYPGATITTSGRPVDGGAGRDLRDPGDLPGRATALPVEGVPLFISAEIGGAGGYFSYQTNPTLTDAQRERLDPRDRHRLAVPRAATRFVIVTQRAWSAQRGTRTSRSAAPRRRPVVTGDDAPAPRRRASSSGTQATFLATVTATPACTIRFQYQASGAGMNIPEERRRRGSVNPWLFSLPSPTAPGTLSVGTLTVQVAAYCEETNDGTRVGAGEHNRHRGALGGSPGGFIPGS